MGSGPGLGLGLELGRKVKGEGVRVLGPPTTEGAGQGQG